MIISGGIEAKFRLILEVKMGADSLTQTWIVAFNKKYQQIISKFWKNISSDPLFRSYYREKFPTKGCKYCSTNRPFSSDQLSANSSVISILYLPVLINAKERHLGNKLFWKGFNQCPWKQLWRSSLINTYSLITTSINIFQF